MLLVEILGLGAAIGLELGLLGGGGSILTVPILVYLVWMDAYVAMPAPNGLTSPVVISLGWPCNNTRTAWAVFCTRSVPVCLMTI